MWPRSTRASAWLCRGGQAITPAPSLGTLCPHILTSWVGTGAASQQGRTPPTHTPAVPAHWGECPGEGRGRRRRRLLGRGEGPAETCGVSDPGQAAVPSEGLCCPATLQAAGHGEQVPLRPSPCRGRTRREMRPHGRRRARSYVACPGEAPTADARAACGAGAQAHTAPAPDPEPLRDAHPGSRDLLSRPPAGRGSEGPGHGLCSSACQGCPSGLTSSSGSRVGQTACAAAVCGREGVPREGTSSANRTPSARPLEHLGPAAPLARMSSRATPRPRFPGRSALSFLPDPAGSHPTSEPWLGQTGHSGHTQQPRSYPQPWEWPAPVLVTVGPTPTPPPTDSPGGCNHAVAAPRPGSRGEARAGAQPGNSQASSQHGTATRPPSPAGRAGHLQLGSPEGNLRLWPAAP